MASSNLFAMLAVEDEVEAPASAPKKEKAAKKTEKKATATTALRSEKRTDSHEAASSDLPVGREQRDPNAAKHHSFNPMLDVARPARRVFDRQSGTGRGREVSKQGHGGWGKPGRDEQLEDAAAPAVPAASPPPPADGAAPAAADAPKVEEPVTVTVEEYLAGIREKRLQVALHERKANEGVDESQWGDAEVLAHDEEAYYEGDASEKGKKKKDKKKSDVVQLKDWLGDSAEGRRLRNELADKARSQRRPPMRRDDDGKPVPPPAPRKPREERKPAPAPAPAFDASSFPVLHKAPAAAAAAAAPAAPAQ